MPALDDAPSLTELTEILEIAQMRIWVNGEPRETGAGTVGALLGELGVGPGRIAVEVNQDSVPRSQHDAFALTESDRVEIVGAVGGG